MITGVGSSAATSTDGYLGGPRSADQRRSPGAPPSDQDQDKDQNKTDRASQPAGGASRPRGVNGKPLSADQVRAISELQARDREVRAHEAAHKAVGGSLAGGMSLSYQTGPDGRQYAVGGEVSIDTGSERDPLATIAKMRQVIAAAQAPAQPSSQDLAVAAAAQATMAEAQRQLSEAQRVQPDDSTSQDAEQKTVEPTSNSDVPSRSSPVAGAYGIKPDAAGGLLSLIA